MNMSELDYRTPSDPQRIKYAGQPTAQGVFEEMQYHLDRAGYLPGDLILSWDWENGREIPKGASVSCTIGCYELGDAYLEANILWYDEEQKKRCEDSFFCNYRKTRKEFDVDQAAKIASAIIKMFRWDGPNLKIVPIIEEADSSDMAYTEQLLNAAGRPGETGYRMTVLTLEKYPVFPLDTYRKACHNAVETADPEKVMFLLEQAESHVENLPDWFYGDIADYALCDYHHIAEQIVDRCTQQQAEAIPANLLLQAVDYEDTDFACKLAQRGIHAGDLAEDIIYSCCDNTLGSLPAELLRLGMQISPEDYSAMYSCLDCNYTEAAAILLERGMDFDAFRQWAAKKNISIAQNDALTQIEAIWTRMQTGEEQPNGGLCMG